MTIMVHHTVYLKDGYKNKYKLEEQVMVTLLHSGPNRLSLLDRYDAKIYGLLHYFGSYTNTYKAISITNVNKGDTIFVSSTRELLMYDGTTFVDHTLFEKLQKLETMIADIRDILGFLPGQSDYESTKAHFESLVDENTGKKE